MKIVAIKKFRDKETNKTYSPGDVISHFSEERVAIAVNSGLALVLNEEEKKDNPDTTEQARKTDTTNQKGKSDTVQTVKNEAAGQTAKIEGAGQVVKSDVDTSLTDIDMAQQWQKVIASVKAFEDAEKLKGYLTAENATEKPRVSVVVALEARIKELSDKVE